MILTCSDIITGDDHHMLFVRYLVHPTLVVDANSPDKDGSVVAGKGFLVHRERDRTPVTLQPLVWEELHIASLVNTASRRQRRGTSITDGKQARHEAACTDLHSASGTYAVIDLATVRGEVLVFKNRCWGPGHFLLFDLNDHPTPSQLRSGVLPQAWR